jgi:hypothetical protein
MPAAYQITPQAAGFSDVPKVFNALGCTLYKVA